MTPELVLAISRDDHYLALARVRGRFRGAAAAATRVGLYFDRKALAQPEVNQLLERRAVARLHGEAEQLAVPGLDPVVASLLLVRHVAMARSSLAGSTLVDFCNRFS